MPIPPASRSWLSDDDVPVAVLLVILAAMACAIPAQADTFYHLRSGQAMWASRWFLDREVFSYVTYGQPHPNHWWLSQLVFYGLYSLGGPVLVTVVSGAFAFLALLGAWMLTRGCSAELRLILLLVLMVGLPEWSVRPQVFSLALMLVTLRLVLADRLEWLPPVMLVWANTHAVVVLGIGVVFAVLLEALLWSRDRIPRALWIAAASAAVPMISPLGVHYWPYLLKVVREARLLGIDEYRSAFSVSAVSVGIWIVVAALIVSAIRALPTLGTGDRRDRILLLASGALAASAIMSVRNAGFFVLVAAPALARLAPATRPRKFRPAGLIAYAFVGIACILTIAGVWYRWRDGGTALGWRPFAPAAIAAIRQCPAPMYNGFNDGGALIWFVPEQRVFVDGRTDAYPIEFLLRAARAELQGEYKALFTDYGIKCAVVGSGSLMARALKTDSSMTLRYSDGTWNVFELATR